MNYRRYFIHKKYKNSPREYKTRIKYSIQPRLGFLKSQNYLSQLILGDWLRWADSVFCFKQDDASQTKVGCRIPCGKPLLAIYVAWVWELWALET